MVRKCRGIAELAVMEVAHDHNQVGVRTRARAALAISTSSSGSAKRSRKFSRGDLKFSRRTEYVQLRSRRQLVRTAEHTSVPSPTEERIDVERLRSVADHQDHCSISTSDHISASCCSSNGSSELVEETIKFVDLEDENDEVEESTYNCSRERRETTPTSRLCVESEELDSAARPSEANSRRRSMPVKTPSDSELEEFFTAAEKDIQKRFVEKYNYDIVKDKPLEGRYEWVQLKP